MIKRIRFYARIGLLLGVGSLFSAAAPAQSQQAGEVEFARGAATAQRPDQAARIIGEGEAFYAGEVLSTSDKSFAVVSLQDGSRLTLRPNTRFVVESINAERNSEAGGLMRLFKGGVRALTGFISKFNKEGLKLETPVATMGIRGTEFDARLCEGDCPGSGQTGADAPGSLAAKIAFARGQLSVRRTDGSQQPVETGATIDAGERVVAGERGVAVLVFKDNSRVTLQPNSELAVRRYRFNRQEPEKGESVLELIRGGLRAVTGLLGKVAPDSVEVETPVATIGIRGTGFDLLCRGRCVQSAVSRSAPEQLFDRLVSMLVRPAHAQNLPADGMYAYVWQGEIEFRPGDGSAFIVRQDNAAFLANRQSEPVTLPNVPEFIRNNPFRRPDKIEADPDQLFPERSGKPGQRLYVSVYDGEVALDDTVLRKGEAGFADPDQTGVRKLNAVPTFMQRDAFPKPSDFKPSVYRLLNELDQPEDEFECQLQ